MRSTFARALALCALASLAGCTDPVGPERLPERCTALVRLDQSLGTFLRLDADDAGLFPCLQFDPASSADHEYLLLLENLSPTGTFAASLFPGPTQDTTFAFSLEVDPLLSAEALVARSRVVQDVRELPAAAATWDFGAGPIREHHPAPPTAAQLGALHALRAGAQDCPPAASAVVGDTLCVLMDALPRLEIPTGSQKAVVRYISDHLIFAEDVRLSTTLVREGGGHNTPMTEQDFAAIAAEYEANARVQGDLLFDGRHNAAVEASEPHRIVVVHSLMPNDQLWGYTYSVSDYLVFDFWVGTDGITRGLNQHPQRVADNLLMHEIAHMRHLGLLQHEGRGITERGQRWLVEGFARFAERLPIAARLLGSTTPSRTGNVVLPRNPAFGNAYFMDDVPTYLHASSSLYFGYHTSAYVFDYFADQIAISGGDWMAALRELVVAAGTRAELDAVVRKWLPGTSIDDLITRARIALYTDDIGTPGLPAWTQYHQFQLRESRPAREQDEDMDPRVQWITLSAGSALEIDGRVAAGTATGYVIRGTASDPPALVRVSGPAQPNARLSLARIR